MVKNLKSDSEGFLDSCRKFLSSEKLLKISLSKSFFTELSKFLPGYIIILNTDGL